MPGKGVEKILDCALDGAGFVFGKALIDPKGPAEFVFAFRVLPTVIFVAALFAVLYHLGVMQWIVRGFAVVMAWLMGTSGAESLNVAASLFLGQTEAPLTIRPYLPRLTRSELLTVMTSGMAHVSGGVMAAYIAFDIEARHILTAVIMTAPGAIMMSKMLVPETEKPETLGTVSSAEKSTDANVLDAASRGTRDGLHLALNIAAMLISFLGLVALVNMGLSYVGTSLQGIVGWAMAPVAYLLGVPWEDCKAIGKLLGTRTVLNELIAFNDLGAAQGPASLDRSLGRDRQLRALRLRQHQLDRHPARRDRRPRAERRHDLARLGVRALARGDPGQLPFGLHRGNSLMTTHAASPPPDLHTRAEEAAAALRAAARRAAAARRRSRLGLERAGRPSRRRHDRPLRPDPPLPAHDRRRA